MTVTLAQLQNALLEADEEAALEVTQALLDGGTSPLSILNDGLAQAMVELGRRWNQGEAFLPEVIAAADIFKQCEEVLAPALEAAGGKKTGPLVVLGTVEGDLHDLGKNIVAALLKTGGFEVLDLGKDVAAETFVTAVREKSPAVVGLSALLTTTMLQQKETIEAFDRAGLRSRVKIVVGGAPVTVEWAEDIGADGYAANAHEAVELVKRLVTLDE